ncbi:MAG: FAD-dependent oxidoreductase [Parachlamydiales bacterium]|nr:FAD-dependent oxidoreductase [Parachlamydiales bacterium]
MKHFDLIVIGSGSGLNIVSKVLLRGKKTKIALIEKDSLGGTCLNKGCIPSKMLINYANQLKNLKKSKEFHIDVHLKKIDFSKIIEETKTFTQKKSNELEKTYKNIKNVTFYSKKASFIDKNTLQVGREIIKGKKIILAVGAKPNIPNIEGLKNTPFMTFEEALFPKCLPKKLIIIGGGYIGVELAFFYSSMGVKVTILEKEKVLSQIDEDIRQAFLKNFKKDVLIKEKVSIDKVEYKNKIFKVFTSNKIFLADTLLVVTGIKADTKDLNLHLSNVKVGKKSNIIVNKHLQTTNKSIFALGDAIVSFYFKHSANFEADYIFNHLFKNFEKPIKYSPMPYAIFSDPEIAGVGKNEKELFNKKVAYFIKKAFYQDVAKGIIEKEEGFLKLIFEKKSEKLIGAHMVGKNASDLIHILVAFMNKKANLNDLKNAVFTHPTMAEIISKAVHDLSE